MNQRIEGLRKYILDKKHHQFRRTADELNISNLSDSFARNDVSPVKRAAICLATLLDKEIPVILPDEKIVLTRTISEIPKIFTRKEWDEIKRPIIYTNGVRYVTYLLIMVQLSESDWKPVKRN